MAEPALHPDAALSLALALVDSSNAPLLLLDGDLSVISVSTSFCRAFYVDRASAVAHPVFVLGGGEWDIPQLRSLLKATIAGHASIEAYEIDLKRPGQATRRLVLNAHKLDYADAAHPRLLLTVADVTEARIAEKLKDDLVREKAILLQELQHRVANSLQIIASILLQSARSVDSKETQGHLQDAHHRVMSIAAVQQKLSASSLGEVALREYLTDLCGSIGASMIRDHDQLAINVQADASVTSPDVSVSLGLIVTELVINALKHAFPDHRDGRIKVKYDSQGDDWTLSVGDDGVGMPHDAASAKSGLGTSIVEALAKQLDAHVVVSDVAPGTEVSIIHP